MPGKNTMAIAAVVVVELSRLCGICSVVQKQSRTRDDQQPFCLPVIGPRAARDLSIEAYPPDTVRLSGDSMVMVIKLSPMGNATENGAAATSRSSQLMS